MFFSSSFFYHHHTARIHGLEYILQNKIDQNILPKSLKFLTNVDNTGLIFLKGIGYRLKACLNRLKAMKRDGEDQQDMVLCIGDPSLDNIIVGTNISTGGLKISLVDLESSGWTDPAYSIAQFLTCNVWCDKTGMLEQNDMFPFEPSFESFIVSIFIENFEWSKNESKFKISDIDNFFFHQPNSFMLKKLANKLKIPLEKIPMNLVEKYGNSSGATIPAVLCSEFDVSYFNEPKWICMAGFGVGLTWGSLLIRLHDLSFVEIMEV